MASIRKLSDVVNWAQSFVGLRPLAGQGGIEGEPALSIANSVLGFLLGPPFCWRWNRNRTSITTTLKEGSNSLYNQSYTVSLADFGFLEAASVSDGTTLYTLEVRKLLPDSTDTGRPQDISSEGDDGEGNITFKLYPVPDQAYTIVPIYQKKPSLFTSLAGVWSPIPDELQYLYNSGFLASVFENANDSRFPVEYQKFIRSVLAAAEGLDDTEKALFLQEKLITLRESQDSQMRLTQGLQARGA